MWGGAKLSKNAIVEIVGKLYDALQLNLATDEINCVHFSTGIYEAVVSCDEVDDRMKAIAYCVMDVNEDGVEELLIVDTVWPEPGTKFLGMKIQSISRLEWEKVSLLWNWQNVIRKTIM